MERVEFVVRREAVRLSQSDAPRALGVSQAAVSK